MFILNANAAVYTINGINYSLYPSSTSENVASVAPGTYTGVVTIPASIQHEGKTYKVKYIGDNAFENTTATRVILPNTIISIGEYSFSQSNISSLVLPSSVKSIGAYAFSGSDIKPLNIQSRSVTFNSDAFKYFIGDILTYDKHVTDIRNSGLDKDFAYTHIYTYESCLDVKTESYLKGVKIIPKIKKVPYDPGIIVTGYTAPTGAKRKVVDGYTIYYGLEPNTSYTFKMNYRLNGEDRFLSFYPTTSSYKACVEQKTQRTISINPVKGSTDVTTGDVTISKFLFDGVEYTPNDTGLVFVDNLIPGKTYNTKATVYYDENKTKSYNYEAKVTTSSLLSALKLDGAVTSSSIDLAYSFENCDAEILSSYYISDISTEIYNSSKIDFVGLEPDTRYSIKIISDVKDCGVLETIVPFTTDSIKIESEDARIIKAGDVVFVSHTNIDNREQNVGFEWRRLDWDDSFNSNHVSCYMFDGSMEGIIKNVNVNALWKYRPYYQSNSGNYYYGDWVSFDPSNTAFYEPIVHTYPDVIINDNNATVKVYVMNGSDAIISRGVRYWKDGFETEYHTVTSKGVIMDINLTSLDFSSSYKFQAFAETEDDVYLGEIKSFDMPNNEIDYITNVKDDPQSVTIYNINGQIIPNLKRGINIVKDSNGVVRKILSR